jgi:acyl-coenzyme A synthetase/AMP-(fatty) acid ligase
VGEEEEENPRIEAFIVLREGFEPSPSREDLLDLARQRLEPAMVPAEVHFVRRLPIFPTGKLDRERLAMVSLAGLWDELR